MTNSTHHFCWNSLKFALASRQMPPLFRRCTFTTTTTTCSSSVKSVNSNAKSESKVLSELHFNNRVVRLVLNAPEKRNALSLDMMNQLLNKLKEVSLLTDARVVILAANGPAFSAGHDLNELRALKGTPYHKEVFSKCVELMEFLQQIGLPVIAEVDGIAAAAGCQLVASTDIVVASDKSTFLVPGAKVGLFCSTPSIPLVRSVPRKIAMDMLLTGRALSAQEALQAGLVSRVVPSGQTLTSTVFEVSEAICSLSKSVLELGKAFVYAQMEQTVYNANRYGYILSCLVSCLYSVSVWFMSWSGEWWVNEV